MQAIAKVYADFDAEAALQTADEEAKGSTILWPLLASVRNVPRAPSAAFMSATEHNRTSAEFNAISYSPISKHKHDADFFAFIVQTQQELDTAACCTQLVNKYEKLVALKDSFNTTFVTSLCHSIYQ